MAGEVWYWARISPYGLQATSGMPVGAYGLLGSLTDSSGYMSTNLCGTMKGKLQRGTYSESLVRSHAVSDRGTPEPLTEACAGLQP